MTDKTLRRLLNKKRLTGKERARILHIGIRLLTKASICFATVGDSCDTAATDLTIADRKLTAKEGKQADRLEDARNAIEDLTEILDNVEIPTSEEVQ